jgi:hypothetical protein
MGLHLQFIFIAFISAKAVALGPFLSTCLGPMAARDNSNGNTEMCPIGTACLCPRYSALNDSWSCLIDETPCRNIPHATPRYPTNSFHASLVGSLNDGSSFTNVSLMWIHDGGNQRERMDGIMWERSPSPDHYFSFRSTRMVTVAGMVYEVRCYQLTVFCGARTFSEHLFAVL